jgi:Fic family protein
MLMPSTRHPTICARLWVLNLFILTIMLEAMTVVKPHHESCFPFLRMISSIPTTEGKGVSIMLFAEPTLDSREREVVAQIEELRLRLRRALFEPRRWVGSLRRLSLARAIQGSNSIEGFNAVLDDVAAAAVGEQPLDADTETTMALWGYRDAMTYVLQLATDPDFEYSEQLLKSLHFMMTSYDLKNRPGLWRAGSIYVHNDDTGEVVYEGPDVDLVPDLMSELSKSLTQPQDSPALVRAGMAHLNLVMIHPFRDGNGRMARCLQTLILAREGILAPQFCSIEEYLGANTNEYYGILGEVGGGRWQPDRDARPWVRFILTAHLIQARTLERRIKESEQLWVELEGITQRLSLPERIIPAMYDAAQGLRVRNATYRAMQEEEEISDQVASRDLRALVDAGLFVPSGERRGRIYTGSDELQSIWRTIRAKRPPRGTDDPFATS